MSQGGDKLKHMARAAFSNTQELEKTIMAMAAKMYRMDREIKELLMKSRATDWRSLAMMKVMSESVDANGVSLFPERVIIDRANKLQIEDFEEDSIVKDQVEGLVSCNDEVAENGHCAIGMMKVFKDGVELEEQCIVRTRFEIGKVQHFPEVDEAVRGLRVGESRRFKLNLRDKTDEAEFFLTGLRKKKAEAATDGEKSEVPVAGGVAQGS